MGQMLSFKLAEEMEKVVQLEKKARQLEEEIRNDVSKQDLVMTEVASRVRKLEELHLREVEDLSKLGERILKEEELSAKQTEEVRQLREDNHTMRDLLLEKGLLHSA